METTVEKDEIGCFLNNYDAVLRKKLRFLNSTMIPMVIIARGLKHYIKTKYKWSEEDASSYLMKCKFTISEELTEDQVEQCIGIVSRIFDVQMKVFEQIEIDVNIIVKNSVGITFEMGVD